MFKSKLCASRGVNSDLLVVLCGCETWSVTLRVGRSNSEKEKIT